MAGDRLPNEVCGSAMSEGVTSPTPEELAAALNEHLAVNGAGEGPDAAPAVEYKVSAAASANVDELLRADADDESLRRYKESLLGAAAKGDLGDTSDPRKLIVTEFQVLFAEEGITPITFHPDTPEGIEEMKKKGLIIKEGAKYKFKISFRVAHQILTGIKYVNRVKRLTLATNEEVVLGSYAPQSQPHVFEFPRRGYNEAPSGMLARGKYTSEDRFIDSDGVQHLGYEYSLTIAKTWTA